MKNGAQDVLLGVFFLMEELLAWGSDLVVQVVQPGTNLTVFTHVTIPKEWGNFFVGKTFHISITAEAIQAANFNPDFSSKIDPWNGVKIE